MNIGVFGASGTIGQRIVAEALSRRHSVTAFARNSSHIGLPQVGVTWKVADVLDSESVEVAIDDVDVIVNSFGVGPRSDSSGGYAPGTVEQAIRNARSLVTAAQVLLKALERRPSLRLIVVGGAASLEVMPGLPENYMAVVEAHRNAMNLYRTSDRNWSYFCPAVMTAPGERTGRFRLGGNEMVIGADGQSRISCEDYAVALLDEVEIPRHLQRRFTIGY